MVSSMGSVFNLLTEVVIDQLATCTEVRIFDASGVIPSDCIGSRLQGEGLFKICRDDFSKLDNSSELDTPFEPDDSD